MGKIVVIQNYKILSLKSAPLLLILLCITCCNNEKMYVKPFRLIDHLESAQNDFQGLVQSPNEFEITNSLNILQNSSPILKKITLGLDTRDAILAPTSTTIKINVPIKPSADLLIGYSILEADWQHEDSVTFSIDVINDSTTARLHEKTITPEQRQRQPYWQDIRLDLHSYAGCHVMLVLKTASSTNRSVQAAWSNPLIVYPRQPRERNIILISIDTLRADRLNSYGYKRRSTTPYIDKFAKNGIRFENAFANSPWTTPSHMSLFTSLYPSAHGLDAPVADKMRRLNPDVKTLAWVLRKSGFITVAFTGGNTVSAKYGFSKGFDLYSEARRYTNHHDLSDLDLTYEKSTRWLDANRDLKFFLFFHTFEVHTPDTHQIYTEELESSSQRDLHNAGYDSDLKFTDRMLGLFFAYLKELELYEKSIIVLLSDHGENIYDRMVNVLPRGHGHHLYDELLRVPLIFVAPGLLPRDVSIEKQVELIDVMPTIIALLNLRKDLMMQGKDLTPFINRDVSTNDRPVFAEAPTYGPDRKAIRTQRYKFILIPDPDDTLNPRRKRYVWNLNWNNLALQELFDLKDDPGETRNILKSQPTDAAQMERLLREIMQKNSAIQKYLKAEPMQLDPKLIERLRSLGYIR